MGKIIRFKRQGWQRWFPTSRGLLLIFILLSVWQYAGQREVTWLTVSFRWVESTAQSLLDNPMRTIKQVGQTVSREVDDLLAKVSDQAYSFDPSKQYIQPSTNDTPHDTPPADFSGLVVRVSDGDTITVLDERNQKVDIRLHGIDAPERGQPFGRASTKALAKMVAGEEVSIVEEDIDQYGRTVAVVYVRGLNANLEMVKMGYAWWYRRYAQSDSDLREAEKRAQRQGKGLWSESSPINPYDWRQGRRD